MEVEERLAADVEDRGPPLDDTGPPAYLGDHVSDIVEQLRRAVHHTASGP
jgi:hypothetical protein